MRRQPSAVLPDVGEPATLRVCVCLGGMGAPPSSSGQGTACGDTWAGQGAGLARPAILSWHVIDEPVTSIAPVLLGGELPLFASPTRDLGPSHLCTSTVRTRPWSQRYAIWVWLRGARDVGPAGYSAQGAHRRDHQP